MLCMLSIYIYIHTYCYISNVSYVEFMLFVVVFCDIYIYVYIYMHKKLSPRYGMLYITICNVLYICDLWNMYIYIVRLCCNVLYIYMLSSKIYVYTWKKSAMYMILYIYVMLCYVFSASAQERSKQTARPFIPGKGCFVSRKELEIRQF